MSADYFKIRLDKQIGTIGVNDVLQLCFIAHIQTFCNSVDTNTDPALPPYTVHVQPINYSSTEEEGIDFDLTYRVPLERISKSIPGGLTVHGLATHYIRAYTNDGFSPPSDDAGVNAGGGLPSWSYRLDLSYALEDWSASLMGRGVSGGRVSNEYIECTSGCPVSTLANPTINRNSIAGAFYVDGSVSRTFRAWGASSEVFLSVRNLFNKSPVIIPLGGESTAVTTSEVVQTNTSLYDVLGRSFHMGVRISL